MTAYPGWTPAPRQGIIPLHPLSFGTILGRSFSALRSNPRVLLGFALLVLAFAYLLLLAGVGATTIWAILRIERIPAGSPDTDAITAGSFLLVGLVSFVLSLLATVLQVIVQGVVVAEVASAALAEKARLGTLWRRIRPVAWRLIGYSLLLSVAIAVAVAVVGGIVILLAALELGGVAIALTVVTVLASIPLLLWLSTKLLLVPSVLVLEHGTIRRAVARSWRLTRGRFWPTLGVVVVINVIFGIAGQVVALPFSLLGGLIGGIFAPTGDPSTAIIALIVTTLVTYVFTLLVQAVAIIVQATAAALVYIDCRMRSEALDIDLLEYVEAREVGQTDLPDPWRVHAGREAPRPAWVGAYPAAVPVQPYPGPPFGGAPTFIQPQAGPGFTGQPYAGQPYPGQPYPARPAAPVPSAPPAPVPAAESAPPAATSWAAPGEHLDVSDQERPWS